MDNFQIIKAGPEGFRGIHLDERLANGFFRSGYHMVAMDRQLIEFNDDELVYDWLFKIRVKLAGYKPPSTVRNIRNRCKRYDVKVSAGQITDEIEDLYRRYHASVDFEIPDSCRENLLDGQQSSPFETMVVELRDGGKLIGAGFLDMGHSACMGVLNIYDPDHKRHSIGKFLIDRKIEYARGEGLQYFYPGSVMLGDERLDYKLRIDHMNTEVYLSADGTWQPYNEYGKTGMEKYLLSRIQTTDHDDTCI
jgi:arginine-tRNA-protein transferase